MLLARKKAAPRLAAISPLWASQSIAGQIARNEFFEAAVVASETVYKGPSARSVRYLGVRTDADLYLGAKDLFP